ncbi:MAG TPA: SDR family NAD(P)-dependent oxidoreductase [Rhizomicrobium sp.]|jgi:NADP-dependent 3-hydroxy acid dehydrogenase YdfG|nr:SDR family NAD(P)-dependent oxidoreductase [Rhizomicrobium sp.]
MDKIAVITGVGPGTGASLARRFAGGGYRVALLARNAERLAALEKEIAGARAYPCDVSDPDAVKGAAAAIAKDMGTASIVIHNAVGGAFGTFLEIDPKVLDRNFQTNTMGLLYLAQAFVPAMIERGAGALIVTGNTAAQRGRAGFAGFAPTKAAQRILAEAIARDAGPKGVHVAYVVIDAVIDVPWARERYKDKPEDFFIKSAAIADEVFHLAHQDKSAWSFNVEIRPFRETW